MHTGANDAAVELYFITKPALTCCTLIFASGSLYETDFSNTNSLASPETARTKE
jgi:hypothetical protein